MADALQSLSLPPYGLRVGLVDGTLNNGSSCSVVGAIRVVVEEARCLTVLRSKGAQVSTRGRFGLGRTIEMLAPTSSESRRPMPRQEQQEPMLECRGFSMPAGEADGMNVDAEGDGSCLLQIVGWDKLTRECLASSRAHDLFSVTTPDPPTSHKNVS